MNAQAAPKTAARKKRARWAILAIGVLAVVVAVVAFTTLSKPKTAATANTSTAKAAKRTINVLVSGSGTSVAADSVTVNPQIDGTVKKLLVSVGDTVTAGDTLYTISSDQVKTSYLQAKSSLLQSTQSVSTSRSQVESAESGLYTAKTQKIQAQKNVWQLQSLPTTSTNYDYNIKIAKRQLHTAAEAVDTAEINVSTAELGLAASQAGLKTSQNSYDTAKKNSGETVVVAPSDGVVTALPISVGSAVAAGASSGSSSGSAGSSSSGSSGSSSSGGSSGSSSSSSSSGSSGSSITITDMTSMQVQITVSEVDIPKLAVGQTASVTFDAVSGQTFRGSVKSILPNATTSSGVVNYTVYIKLDTIDPTLRTGMTATVDVETQVSADVLAVPSAAVRTEGGTKYVLVVDGSGATQRKTVKAGVSDDTYTEILSGITEGTVVSTDPATATTTNSGGRPGGGPGGL